MFFFNFKDIWAHEIFIFGINSMNKDIKFVYGVG